MELNKVKQKGVKKVSMKMKNDIFVNAVWLNLVFAQFMGFARLAKNYICQSQI